MNLVWTYYRLAHSSPVFLEALVCFECVFSVLLVYISSFSPPFSLILGFYSCTRSKTLKGSETVETCMNLVWTYYRLTNSSPVFLEVLVCFECGPASFSIILIIFWVFGALSKWHFGALKGVLEVLNTFCTGPISGTHLGWPNWTGTFKGLSVFETLWTPFWRPFWRPFETFLQKSLTRCTQLFKDIQGPIQNHEKGCL